jgi:DNA adenine methylase
MGCVSLSADVTHGFQSRTIPHSAPLSIRTSRTGDAQDALTPDRDKRSSKASSKAGHGELIFPAEGEIGDAHEFVSEPTVLSPARPFVKWAGGKRQLLPDLLSRIPQSFRHYHEPFVGGGALFFALCEQRRLDGKAVRLTDINVELVNTYRVVRDRVETLIALLSTFQNDEAFYYNIRSLDLSQLDPVQRAARFIYLNKTCFNGLFRENRQGRFNVPFGHYKTAQICAPNDLRSASYALRGVCLEVASFHDVEASSQPGDFVYCDPPYAPVSRTASFTAYNGGGFGDEDQQKLADLVTQLGQRGVSVLLSNSAVPLTYSLYRALHVEEVLARRAINSRGDRRGHVPELLVAAGPLVSELRKRSSSVKSVRAEASVAGAR